MSSTFVQPIRIYFAERCICSLLIKNSGITYRQTSTAANKSKYKKIWLMGFHQPYSI